MYSRGFCLGFFVISDTAPLLELQNAVRSKLRKCSTVEARTPISISSFPIYAALALRRRLDGGCSRLLSKRPAASYSICNKQHDRKAEGAYTPIT